MKTYAGGIMPDRIQAEWIREETAVNITLYWGGLTVEMTLSVDRNDLPDGCFDNSYRVVEIDTGTVEGLFDFNAGFTDLHTEYYRHILAGTAPVLTDALPALNILKR